MDEINITTVPIDPELNQVRTSLCLLALHSEISDESKELINEYIDQL